MLRFYGTDIGLNVLHVVCPLHLWQCGQHVFMISTTRACALVQNSHGAGVRLRADCAPEALLELDLHLRNDHRPDVVAQGVIALPLLLRHPAVETAGAG